MSVLPTIFRMPTFFGPSLGPRQGPDLSAFENAESPRQITIQATFEANLEPANLILPEGLELRAPNIINFMFGYISDIEWLAGRGYNIFGVYVPARFEGADTTVHGSLNLVLWENMADPILTGREDLGVSKLFCELPAARNYQNTTSCAASWDGQQFAELRLEGLKEAEPGEPLDPSAHGLLHHKYIPRTGKWGEPDCDTVTFTPGETPNSRLISYEQTNTASIQFEHRTWEQLPTLFHIVSKLKQIELGACLRAERIVTVGSKDIRDQTELPL